MTSAISGSHCVSPLVVSPTSSTESTEDCASRILSSALREFFARSQGENSSAVTVLSSFESTEDCASRILSSALREFFARSQGENSSAVTVPSSFSREMEVRDASCRKEIEAEQSKELNLLYSDLYRGPQPVPEKEQCEYLEQQFVNICLRDDLRTLFKDICLSAVEESLLIDPSDPSDTIDKALNGSLEELIQAFFALDQSPILTLREFGAEDQLLTIPDKQLRAVFDFKRDLLVRRWIIGYVSELMEGEIKENFSEEKINAFEAEKQSPLEPYIAKLISGEFGRRLRAIHIAEVTKDLDMIFKGFIKRCSDKTWGFCSHSLTSDLTEGESRVDSWIENSMIILMQKLKEQLPKEIALPLVVLPQIESPIVLQRRYKEEMGCYEREIKEILTAKVVEFRKNVTEFL